MTDDNRKKDDLFKSLVTSLCVCVPSFCFSFYIIETGVNMLEPSVEMTAILCIAIANFAVMVALEQARSRLGAFTLPALLGVTGLVLLYAIAESINRFVRDIGYEWLLPVVAACLALSTVAIFRERTLALKLHLAVNSLALAVLWGLGAAGKVSLPF